MAEKNTDRPQSEPEIIPPGQQPDSGVWQSETVRGDHRFYVRRLGPFEIILWVVIIGAILAIGVGLLLGLFLIAIPLMVVLITIAIVSAVVRGYFHRQ
jgi:TM2 domain-containing membrane protein YozV